MVVKLSINTNKSGRHGSQLSSTDMRVCCPAYADDIALVAIHICNDRTFCVIILEGYGVAGMYIVVLGHSDRMFGCLGDRLMCLPPRRWRQAAPRGS